LDFREYGRAEKTNFKKLHDEGKKAKKYENDRNIDQK
jgi:hypothetical protein